MRKLLWLLCIGLLGCQSCNAGLTRVSSERWVVWSAQPAKTWEDAFVTGNGNHGTMVNGLPGDERVICVHEELFIRGWDHNKETVPVTAQLLPEVRRLIDEHKNAEAANLITSEADRQLNAMGAFQRTSCIPHPAFDLCMQSLSSSASNPENYRRQLDLETGEAKVFYDGENGITESVFSSREHNVNVVRLKAGKHSKVNTRLSLKETPGRKGMSSGHNLDSAFLSIETNAVSGWLSYKAKYRNDPGGYEGLARVTTKGGKMIQDASSLRIENADEVLLVIRITPLKDGNETKTEAVRNELRALPATYGTLLSQHRKKHADMFCRMQFDLGCAEQWKEIPTEQMLATVSQNGVSPLFLEQIHAMGRYLLISTCGKYPPPLQGIWGGSWTPAWAGGFVWDSNINLAISAASLSNLAECAESYCNHVESLLPGWRLNAKNYLGCRGFLIAHYNDPDNGYLTHFINSYPWMCWAGGAGWNIRPFYEYAMCMGDDDMLKNRVLPLYREMADFYEDFLVMGSDSLFHVYPSISPENSPNGDYVMLTKDATMDVAIAREVFEILGDMGKQFNLPQKDRDKWAYYLDRLPQYRINEDGALAEWVDPNYTDLYRHRHLSHLYPAFPGTQIGKYRGGKQLEQAAQVALDKRFQYDTSSAHGLFHLALQGIRVGDNEKVVKNLDRFSRRHYVYDGLVTSHNPEHDVYNLDAILSFPRLLMEMVVYTEPGRMELLPAWPKEYADGSLQGVRLYGGHTLDISWKKGELADAVLYAGRDESCEVYYRGAREIIKCKKGKTYRLSDYITTGR